MRELRFTEHPPKYPDLYSEQFVSDLIENDTFWDGRQNRTIAEPPLNVQGVVMLVVVKTDSNAEERRRYLLQAPEDTICYRNEY